MKVKVKTAPSVYPGSIWKWGRFYFVLTSDLADDGYPPKYGLVCLTGGDLLNRLYDTPEEAVDQPGVTYVGRLEIDD